MFQSSALATYYPSLFGTNIWGFDGYSTTRATSAQTSRPAESRPIVISSVNESKVQINTAIKLSVFETISRLRAFRTWPDNWDGEGSPAPSVDAVNAAIEMASLLLGSHIGLKTHLNSLGLPVLFIDDAYFEGEIEFIDADHVNFEIAAGHQEEVFEDYAVHFDRDALPTVLASAFGLS